MEKNNYRIVIHKQTYIYSEAVKLHVTLLNLKVQDKISLIYNFKFIWKLNHDVFPCNIS